MDSSSLTPGPDETTSSPVNVFARSVALSLEIGKVGVRRKVATRAMQVTDAYKDARNNAGMESGEPDPNAINVSKEILTCREYDAIGALDNQIRTDLAKLALPAPVRRGIYLVPLELLDRVDSMVSTYEAKREDLVSAFLAAYMDAVNEARVRLGALYSPADYPPVDRVLRSFYVSKAYIDLGLPANLATVNADMYRREQTRFRDQLANAADDIRAALRESFADLIGHMADRLTPNPDGTKKIFRDSAVQNLREFMGTFNARNIADDADLDRMVADARALLGNANPDELRGNNWTRAEVTKGLNSIKANLDTMLATAPRRKFRQ